MKKIFLLLAFASFITSAKAQYLRVASEDGTTYILGTNKIVSAFTDQVSGETVYLYGQKLTTFRSDSTLASVVTNGCGKFFMITDQANSAQRAINKDYVERIYMNPDSTTTIVMRDLELGNPLRTIQTVEKFDDLNPGILNCSAAPAGPQVISRVNNDIILSGGGGSVNLDDLLDNSDNQVVTTFSFSSGVLSFELQNGGGLQQVNLTALEDDWGNQVVVTDGITTTGTGVTGDSIKVISNTYVSDGSTIEALVPNDTLNVSGSGLIDVDVVASDSLIVGIDFAAADTNQIIVYDGDSLVWQDVPDSETITTISSTDSTFTYINEASDTVTVNFLSDETITTLTDNTDGTFSYINEQGDTTTFTSGFGALNVNNGLYFDSDTIKMGGPLVENTVINHSGFTVDWNNAPRFRVTNDSNGDAIEASTGFGARLTGTSQNEVQLNATSLIVDGGTGKTFWKYGGTPISVGSILQCINGATAEVNYAPYTFPTTNIGAENYILQTNSSGNLEWTDADDIGGAETITTLVDNEDGSFTYTNEAGQDTTWTETVTVLTDNGDSTFSYTNEIGAVTTIDLSTGGDNWGADSFTFSADAGTPQTVLANDNIEYTGENLIETEAGSGDELTVRINSSGASVDDVITFDGASVVWAPGGGSETVTTLIDNSNGSFTYTNEDGVPVTYFETLSTLVPTGNPDEYIYTNEQGITTIFTTGDGADDWGTGTFTVTGDSGPAQTINESENLVVNGANLITTTTSSNDNLEVAISTSGASTNDVITYDGANVVWSPSGGGADDWGSGSFIVAAESGSNQTITQGNTLTITGSNLLATTASATDVIDVEISTVGASTNDVITYDGANVVWAASAGGSDDWGTGNFIVSADSGPNQTIDEGNTLDLQGANLIETVASATDVVTTQISTSGASTNDVITYDGANVVWAASAGGSDDWGTGNFIVSAESGPNQTIDEGNTLNLTGSNLITTVASATDNVDITIDGTGASTNDVIKWDGANAVWDAVPETVTQMVHNGDKTYTYTNEVGTMTTLVQPVFTADCSAFSFSVDANGDVELTVSYPECASASVGCPCYQECDTGEDILIVKE